MTITYAWELRRESDDIAVQSGTGESPGGPHPEPGNYYLWVEATEDEESAAEISSVVVLSDPSSIPLNAVIHDDGNSSTGAITRMGPCFIGFRMTSSSFGSGDFGNILPEWDFGDDGSPYNHLRGFSAGHFYDIEPSENESHTVTLTLTNVDQESDQATRTVTITPNTRTKVYIDPDIGISAPTDPSNPATPYDTAASAWAGTSGSNIEFILTAGKTHTWTTPFSGAGSRSNILVRTTERGAKANVVLESDFLIGTADFMGAMDLHFVASTRTTGARILDARRTTENPSRACWAVDCTSEDSMVIGGITNGSSYYALWQNVQVTDETALNSIWVGGEGCVLLGCRVEHGNAVGVERPVRGSGNHLLLWECELISNSYKEAYTRNGGVWLWIHGCTFTSLSGTGGAVSLAHNFGDIDGVVGNVVMDRCLLSAPNGTAGNGAVLALAPDDQALHGAVVRNTMCRGGSIMAKQTSFAEGQLIRDIRIYNTTIDHNTDGNSYISFLAGTNRDIVIRGNLGISATTKTEHTIRITGNSDLILQAPLVSDNITPPVSDGKDIYAGTADEAWSVWNARNPSYGTGNKAKSITLDAEFRPIDIETDADLVVTMPPDMINFQEDYYGNPRDAENWTVGAIAKGEEPEPIYRRRQQSQLIGAGIV